jgi:hypothetical protein
MIIVNSKIGEQRIIKKTPAVTKVAACIKADTGVGPSIASGSQPCNPSWADFPTPPITKNTPINSPYGIEYPKIKTNLFEIKGNNEKTTLKSTDLNKKKIRLIAPISAQSPIRFSNIALSPAFIADSLECQKLINKNEHKPIPSQPVKSTKKLSATTNNSIKNVNKDNKEKNFIKCESEDI